MEPLVSETLDNLGDQYNLELPNHQLNLCAGQNTDIIQIIVITVRKKKSDGFTDPHAFFNKLIILQKQKQILSNNV